MPNFLLLLFPLMVAGSVLGLPKSSEFPNLVSLELKKTFKRHETANIFLTLKETPTQVLASIVQSGFVDRVSKLNAIYNGLQNHATATQQPIVNYLSLKGIQHWESFWVTNQVYIKNADRKLILELGTKFPHLLQSIEEEQVAHLIEPVQVTSNLSLNSNEPQWGIVRIQAPKVWKEMEKTPRNTDNEVLVATIDTGVRWTHQALKENFVGDYGWFDPYYQSVEPNDHNGHGTHTTGTIVGRNGIGVAPLGAKWAACKGCPTVFCFQSSLLACGQFMLCPTLPDGSSPDCSRAPRVVSNSWGLGRGNTWYNGVIDAWHTAGIIPVFSIGNSGPVCHTADSPGDQVHVIGVGSTGIQDEISYFSSLGPSLLDNIMKPEVVAPGSDIISAYHSADDAYASMSGTSMACPNVAGTIVLLLQASNKDLSYEQVKQLLMGSTDQNLKSSGRVCDGVGDGVFPNHVFGHGRINALRSFNALKIN